MIRIDKRLVLVLSACIQATATHAVSFDPGAADRNYQVIVERNPFGLKPPAPPPTNAPPVVAPKDEILLTGIVAFGGLRAYFMTKAPQGKTPEYYNLAPDEKKNGLEVLEINTQSQSVRVRNAGVESVMTFASNGVKPPATPATPTPGTPGANLPVPGMPGVPAPGGTPGFNPGFNQANPAAGAPGAVGAPGSGRIRTIPSRNLRTPTVGGNAAMEPSAPQRADPNAAVQDVLMMELQKRANPNVTFPPTPMPPIPQ